MNLYLVKDKVSGTFFEVCLAETDGACIRNNLVPLSRMRPVDDLQFVRVGELDFDCSEGFNIKKLEMKVVSNDAYKFPETVSKAINQLNFEQNVAQYQLDKGSENREAVKAPVK